MKIKNFIKLLLSLMLVLIFIYGCESDNKTAVNDKDSNEYSEIITNKSDLTLSELQGNVVIIDFWATWCPPCREGIPDLIELKNEYDQLEVVGISLDAISRGGATADDVVPFIKQFGINYPVVKGGQDVAMQYGGIQSIPTSFVIDRRGFVISRHIGLVPKETYKNDIEKALAGNYNREEYVKAPDFTLPVIK